MPVSLTAPLSATQLRAYREDGFVILRGLFSPEQVNAVLAEGEALRKRDDLVDPRNLRCRFMPHEGTGELLFEVFDPVADISPAVARMAADPTLHEILAAIYGEPACLFKDKLIYKPPGARGYGLHQDWIAWPGFPRSFLTVLVALDPADAANGCTELFAGVHQRGCLSAEDGQYHELSPERMGDAPKVPLVLAPGDAAVFGGYVPHRSAPNRSAGFRRQLFLSYNARSDGGDLREWHYQDFHRRIRERRQGAGDVYFR